MLIQCWLIVSASGPTLHQHWFSVVFAGTVDQMRTQEELRIVMDYKIIDSMNFIQNMPCDEYMRPGNIRDAGTTLNHNWINVSCLLSTL